MKPFRSERHQEQAGTRIIAMDHFRQRPHGQVDLFSLEERLTYLKRFGDHCLSFSLLQPGMHFFDIPEAGFIAFMERWGTRFVLADPVCDKKDKEFLLREFLHQGKSPTFVQISQDIARLIHEKFGYYTTQFGVEMTVDLRIWDLKGKKKQVLRTSVNNAKKAGVTIEEGNTTNQCQRLTDEWLQTRKVKNREIVFLIRPMDMAYQEGTRRFYAYIDGELIGFIYFDPVFSENQVIGYVPNISRFSSKFKQGIFYPLMIHAMETFKSEGIPYLFLGLCPLASGDQDIPGESRILKRINRLMYAHGNWIFSFKGLYFTKSRFGGEESPIFGGTKHRFPLRAFLTLLKVCNVF